MELDKSAAGSTVVCSELVGAVGNAVGVAVVGNAVVGTADVGVAVVGVEVAGSMTDAVGGDVGVVVVATVGGAVIKPSYEMVVAPDVVA